MKLQIESPHMESARIDVAIGHLLRGAIAPLGDERLPSGIAKTPHIGPLWLGLEGLAGDEQADRVHHGGPDKALHHYPFEHYAAWRDELATAQNGGEGFELGGFGENLSTLGLTENETCIGDVFSLGEAQVQISQGRSPCRKLNLRFGVPDMVSRVHSTGRTGWYYRVLQAGYIHAGDALILQERPCPGWHISRVQQTLFSDRIDRSALMTLAALPQIASNWRTRAANRLLEYKSC